jgi:competence ComEA-like helix-hairpin-helix protein
MEQVNSKKQQLVCILFAAAVILFLSSVYAYSGVYFKNSPVEVYVKEPDRSPVPGVIPSITPTVIPQVSPPVVYHNPEILNSPVRKIININTADKDQLCLLPGIGEKRAEDIITHRREHGLYKNPEDIMKVKGIGIKIFEKIKDHIVTE